MRFAKAIFRERRKRESWRAFSCPRSRGPRCFARLTAVLSLCGGLSGFFSARFSQRIRDGKSWLLEVLLGRKNRGGYSLPLPQGTFTPTKGPNLYAAERCA